MKLSPEQKESNKRAKAARDRAYRQRKRAFYAAQTEAKDAVDKGPLAAEWERQDRLRAKRVERFSVTIGAVQAQIDLLNERKKKLEMERHEDPEDDSCEEARIKWQSALNAAQEEVDKKFPDVRNCWSVSAWVIPPDVQAEMDKARLTPTEK